MVKRFNARGICFGLGGIALVLLMGLGFIGVEQLSSASKSNILRMLEDSQFREIIYIFLNSYSSLKKTADVIHFPYWFKDSKLEIIQLQIDPIDIGKMNSLLPEKKFIDPLLEENRSFVPAVLAVGEYNAEVEVRYRGYGGTHWNNGQRSLLIKFPKEKLFHGNIKALDLIVPYDRNYILEMTSVERARRAGMKTRRMFLVRVRINGGDAGVYLAQERFSKEWLAVSGFQEDSEVFETGREAKNSQGGNGSGFWRRAIQQDSNDFDPIKALVLVVNEADNDEFKKNIGVILDVEEWYKAIGMNVIAGNAHYYELGNFNLFFNSATGKLEPLLEDMSGSNWEENLGDIKDVYEVFDPITRRILSVPEFYSDYRNVLEDLLKEENSSKDIAFYDNSYEESRVDFYKDRTKHRSDISFDLLIKKNRKRITDNYAIARKIASIEDTPVMGRDVDSQEKLFSSLVTSSMGNISSFRHIAEASYGVSEFLKNNPGFTSGESGILLPRGVYAFDKDIIIPGNTKLTIEEGVVLYFAPGKSLIAYSPIEARGSLRRPIKIARKNADKNWGSVAIANVQSESVFDNVIFIGGSSSEKINGVVFTAMLSAHNAPLVVRDSKFYKDSDDDMINVKYAKAEIINSEFFDSSGDAIDLDISQDFVIKGNTFSDVGDASSIGGDAIDVSYSEGLIADNEILKCRDKGVSVGEQSNTQVLRNRIRECDIGVAVKDLSKALLAGNTFIKNREAISIYQKKEVFGGGEAVLSDNHFEGNEVNIFKDAKSTYRDQ